MTLIRTARPAGARQQDTFTIRRGAVQQTARGTVVAPSADFWRQATCEEVRCPHYLQGWRTTVDPATSLGLAQAEYIRRSSGRRFTEQRQASELIDFTFEPGQRCFRADQHKLPLERSPLFEQQTKDAGHLVLPFPEWADRFNTHMEKTAKGR